MKYADKCERAQIIAHFNLSNSNNCYYKINILPEAMASCQNILF